MSEIAADVIGLPQQQQEEEEDEEEEHHDDTKDIDSWSDARPRKPTDELTAYLKSVGGSLASALQDDERHALIRNVFEEINGHEASLACSRRTSFVVEALLREASIEHCGQVLENVKAYFGFCMSNRQASHVLQTVLVRCYQHLAGMCPVVADDDDDDEDDDHHDGGKKDKKMTSGSDKLVEIVIDLCDTLIAGKSPEKHKRQKKEVSSTMGGPGNKNKNQKFAGALHSFLNDMSKWPGDEIKQACTNPHACPVVQLILENARGKKNENAWGTVLDKMLGDSDLVFWQFSKDRVASHVIEIVLVNCDDSRFSTLFERCIQGQMIRLAEHPSANFCLQHGLKSMRTAEQCQVAIEELEPALLNNKSLPLGVLWRLVQACSRAEKSQQRKLVRTIIKRMRTTSSKNIGIAQALLQLDGGGGSSAAAAGEKNDSSFQNVQVSVLGARIIQAILQLVPESCRPVLESIASMDERALLKCCTDPVAGKLVMETLMDAPSTANWAKQRVILKVKPSLETLAQSKFAWHVLRKAFDAGGIKEKTLIAKALQKVERKIKDNSNANNLLRHAKVDLYKKHPQQWQQAFKVTNMKRRQADANSMLDQLDNFQKKRKT